MYPEVFVIYSSNSKRVFLRRNGAWSEAQHDPWFLAETVPSFRDSEDERAFDNLVKRIEPSDVEILVFNEKTWRYDVKKKALKVVTNNPLDVRRLVKLLEKYRVHHGLSNVSYIARCSLDLIDSVFGYRVPLILYYTEGELEQILADIYERSKSLRVAAIDIEVESRGSFPKQGDRVLLAGVAISELDNDPEVTILEGDDVLKLPEVVLKSTVDYVTGFNALGFDLPYYRAYTDDQRIIASVQQAGLVDNGNIVPLIDLYLFAKNYGPSLGLKSHTSRSLDQVAKDLGLISKEEEEIERSIDRNNIYREYTENREKVLRYLETDVKLTFRIARKWIPVLVLLHSLTAISPYAQQWLPSMGSLAEYAMVEYIMRKHRVALEVRSRKWDFGEVEESFIPWTSRGHKLIAVEGVYSNVLQLDFDMLYPTIGYEFKVDPTSVTVSDSGFPILLFREYEVDGGKKKKLSERQLLKVSFSGGPVHEFFSRTYEIRRITKRLKKAGIGEPDSTAKVLANSCYGIFSKARGSGLNEVISGFIFTKANQILNCTRRYVEQVLRRRVVYGDTDSLFILLEPGDDPKALEEAVNKFVKVFGEGFSVKLEGVHSKLGIYSAKNYICLTSGGEVIIKGFHRYHVPSAVKESLPEIVRRVLEGEEPRKVIEEILSKAKIEDLFVYSVKPIDELYDEDERRFKESSHAIMRASLLAYISSVVGFTPKENQVLRGTAMDIVITAEDTRSRIVLSAHWLSRSNDVVCILRRVVGPNRAELLCGRFLSKPSVSESAMRQPAVVWVEEADRSRLMDMALRTAKTLIETLSKIYSMTGGGK